MFWAALFAIAIAVYAAAVIGANALRDEPQLDRPGPSRYRLHWQDQEALSN